MAGFGITIAFCFSDGLYASAQNHPHRYGRFLRFGRIARTAAAQRPAGGGGVDAPRSVICAASYEARQFGLRSAMSVAAAKRRCPQAVYIAPHFDLYREVSQQIHAVFAQYTDLIAAFAR